MGGFPGLGTATWKTKPHPPFSRPSPCTAWHPGFCQSGACMPAPFAPCHAFMSIFFFRRWCESERSGHWRGAVGMLGTTRCPVVAGWEDRMRQKIGIAGSHLDLQRSCRDEHAKQERKPSPTPDYAPPCSRCRHGHRGCVGTGQGPPNPAVHGHQRHQLHRTGRTVHRCVKGFRRARRASWVAWRERAATGFLRPGAALPHPTSHTTLCRD